MPMPMPVLPAVPSTMIPPGRNAPRAIASRMIASAARSLTEPPGFMNSALPRIVQPVASEAALSWISGVWPIASTTVGLKGIGTSFLNRLGEAARAGQEGSRRRAKADVRSSARAAASRRYDRLK